MTTHSQDGSGHNDIRRRALYIGLSGAIGSVIGAAAGENGALIGLGAAVGAAVGLILMRARGAFRGRGSAELGAAPDSDRR